jgi:hypothetical protein
MKLLHINFFPETIKEIKIEAKENGVSVSALIRMIVMNHVKNQKEKKKHYGTE